MTFIAVCCPLCQSDQIVKRGKPRRGTQRSSGQNTACTTGSLLLVYRHRGASFDLHRDNLNREQSTLNTELWASVSQW
jgi:hypothetical protein